MAIYLTKSHIKYIFRTLYGNHRIICYTLSIKADYNNGSKMRIHYSNPNKWQKEQSFFDTFLSRIEGITVDSWDKGESPDYIIHTNKKMFGVEVTTLVLNSPNADTPLAAIRAAQTKCLLNAKKLAEEEGLEPVEVKVNFRSDYEPIDIEYASCELFEYIKRRVSEIDDSKCWHEYETDLKYSKWISIHLGTTNGKRWLNYQRFDRIHMISMDVDPIDAIQACINSKQQKIHTYLEKCNDCWLLIGADECTAPEAVALTEKTIKHVFEGSFQRIFFLLNVKSELFELSIKSVTS
jgi:hypothetical protein